MAYHKAFAARVSAFFEKFWYVICFSKIATEVLKRLVKYGFEELRLHRLFGVIFDYNKPSQKLFERCKFRYDGVHREARFWEGKYYDEVIMSILSQEYFG